MSEESHGQRSLMGFSPWVCKEVDTTNQVNTYTLLIYSLRLGTGFTAVSQYRGQCQAQQ